MVNKKQIKNSKYKNTGFLFELLTRQVTLEILNNSQESAKTIIKKFFNNKTELFKELRLCNLLVNEKYKTETRAEKFIDTVIEAHSKINHKKLNSEKYELIKTIKESFDINDFLSSPISNYKVLASVNKLFEANRLGTNDVKDVFDSKITLIEHISTNSKPTKEQKDTIIESYRKESKDIRLLAYKILLEKFNDKYSTLDDNQKFLLKEYINNVNNTSNFRGYYIEQIKSVRSELKKLHESVKQDDKVTSIKINEVINVIDRMKYGKTITDNQVSALMISYELVKELKRAN